TLNVAGAFPILEHDPGAGGYTMDTRFVTGIFAHELSHAFGLHEEYEGSYGPTSSPATAEVPFIQRAPNVTHRSALTTPIDAQRIKWNWHRVALASVSAAIAGVGGGATATRVQVTLTEAAFNLWLELLSEITGKPVFLRTAQERFHPLKVSPELRLT